ncbi:glycoside hydrolase family 35 protein [Agromyces italicus]|uniref:glycoside hydrolase family 35 protein n=1 Tax=Agromyces italicus TaxID=279572 RepID=UPI0003B4D031|nr:glycoside hydrolase family 35 protein [Agromyces italicus]
MSAGETTIVNSDATGPAPKHPQPLLTIVDGELHRDARPHRILSGSLHYFRVHPEQWRDRLERLVALGLNTVDTYVAWNFHERRRGELDWSDWRDLEGFIALAAELGLDVIVRPGPYICAEWDNGGFPAWLSGSPGMRLRSSHPAYLDAVDAWFDELLPRLVPLQATHGGPIVAVQLENEYGSYGDDADYLEWLRDRLVAGGISELIYTADGPTELMQDGGSLPGVLATATFGSRAAPAASMLRARRDGEPFVCAELWNGWFDHWGDPHHVRTPAGAAGVVADILAEGGSLSLYMAHGGTNFGLWSGANHDGVRLQPTQTSYDSHAPVAENGAITEKFRLIREVLVDAAGRVPDEASPTPPVLPAARLALRPVAGLLETVRRAGRELRTAMPPSFEELGLDAGLALYRADPIVPRGGALLTVRGLRDRAVVFADGVRVAVLDAEQAAAGVRIAGEGRAVVLELLVENQGRINYGPLLGEGKGILGGVQLDRRLVQRWTTRALPLDEWDAEVLEALAEPAPHLVPQDAGPNSAVSQDESRQNPGHGPDSPEKHDGAGLASATLHVDQPADAFLAFPGSGKGFVWVNGFLLGRYWEIGPQLTYYVPAPLVRAGENTITVLELEHLGDHVELREAAELGPEQEYIETFD